MIDHEAVTLARLYRSAQTSSSSDRIFYLQKVGNQLLDKKESLGHGRWLEWVRANKDMLGFSAHGAHDLIRGAQWLSSNWQLANELEEIVTDPCASESDLAKADEIRRLISFQFYPAIRGTLGRRRNEWYIPPEYITLARTVLGDIDVDPASSEIAQKTVKAGRYFDKQQNGLQQPWYGRVWLNPPYAKPLIGKFISKLLMEWDSRRVTACIALTHNYTDTTRFHDVAAVANAVCFTQGRVRFYEQNGDIATPTQGQAFFYFGSEIDAFKHTFGRVGLIVRAEPDFWSRQRLRDEAKAN